MGNVWLFITTVKVIPVNIKAINDYLRQFLIFFEIVIAFYYLLKNYVCQ